MSARTRGINHLGLTVADVAAVSAFFVEVLGWDETGNDPDYPKRAVSDGLCRLTLWGAKGAEAPRRFDRHGQIGLHHLALEIPTEAELWALAETVRARPDTTIEFMPEPMGQGPRMHMIFALEGGPRIELTWPGPG